jgi:hypothetical protein
LPVDLIYLVALVALVAGTLGLLRLCQRLRPTAGKRP